ncbi:hypothetical protein JG687_00001173 [Phytophthora cactorum]|uniref:Uncharacterized protein n=2 Tax=Phytophthora cactorum TaxID=29920 RepID=A0A8T1V1M7_9STRA|nr:hypothetical protein JG687_00001173 [Phytophthora cactorum]
MAEDASSTVRVCLTRCPLPPAEKNVHSLPCRIHFDGSAPVKTFFQPLSNAGNISSTAGSDEQDVEMETEQEGGKDDGNNKVHAEFRGIQLQGEKLQLAPLGFTGLVLEDSGMRHPDDEGRIWEVEDHFDELTWWDVTNHTTSETQQLPLVLKQWRDLASAKVIRTSDRGMVARRTHPLCDEWAAHSHKLATRNKTLLLTMAALRVRLGDAVAKLVLLPVVGVSLCGAVTLILGLQWMEALQRQRQAIKWRAQLWSMLLALLVALMPAKRLEAAVTPHCMPPIVDKGLEKGTSKLLNSGDKRDAHDGDVDRAGEENYASRPLKRQRSEPGEKDSADQTGGQDNEKDDQGQAGEEENTDDGDEGTPGETLKTKGTTKRVRRRVLIWDLDETLVLFASLYTGTFAQMHGKEVAPGVALGEQMMTFLLAMLEKHFFFSELHDRDVDHITQVAADNETAASRPSSVPDQQQPTVQERYERIREIYERRGHVDFLHDTNSEWFAIRGALVAAIDNFSTGWLHEARQVLELTAESVTPRTGSAQPEASFGDSKIEEEEVENVNVLVTNTQLVPALCKCLIYQLDAFFPIDCVYSSAKVHKSHCFETIMEKYEAGYVEFIAIGDGLEEEQASLDLGLEFHKIRSLVDLKRLRYDLQLVKANSNSSTSSAAVVDSPAVAAAQLSVASSPVGQTAVV